MRFFTFSDFQPVPMLRLVLVVLLASPACAQSAKPPDDQSPRDRRADSVITRPAEALGDTAVASQTIAVQIGETPVELRTTERPCADVCWSALNVHDDENTAVEAALAEIAARGGRLVEVRHGGTRMLDFRLNGEAFTVDPNRIFTDAGRARTLAALSRDTPAARAAVAAFADTLLAVYGTPSVVVALHNNTEAAYSALSYQPGGSEANEAETVHLAPGADTDDFVFVTTRALFDAVVASGFNAILQNSFEEDRAAHATPTDDGSLSVWAAQNGRPYLNIEAQHGHLAENRRMIAAIRAWVGER